MTHIGVLEARNNLSALIKRARAGEDVVITSRDEPQVRLVPVDPPPEHGTGAAILAVLASLDSLAAGNVNADQIEAIIDAERNGWQ